MKTEDVKMEIATELTICATGEDVTMITFQVSLCKEDYNRWKTVGDLKGLEQDSDIATFLVHLYEQKGSVSQTAPRLCTGCHNPLLQVCVHCKSPHVQLQFSTKADQAFQQQSSSPERKSSSEVESASVPQRELTALFRQPSVLYTVPVAACTQGLHDNLKMEAGDSLDTDLDRTSDDAIENIFEKELKKETVEFETLQCHPSEKVTQCTLETVSSSQTQGTGLSSLAVNPLVHAAASAVNPLVHAASGTINGTVGCMYKEVKMSPNPKSQMMLAFNFNNPLVQAATSAVNPLVNAATGAVNGTSGCMHKGVKMAPDQKSQMMLVFHLRKPSRTASDLNPVVHAARGIENHHVHAATGSVNITSGYVNMGAEELRGTRARRETNGSGNKLMACKNCSATFTQHCDLLRHRLTHRNENKCTCRSCSATFKNLSELAEHVKTHKCDQFICDICGMNFRHMYRLKAHRLRHTGERTFACKVCGKAFIASVDLRQHELCHVPEEEKKHVCQYCSLAFTRSSYLKRHQVIHTGEKPFQCDFCGRTFAHRNSFNIHRRIHTGDKPYKCQTCGKSFAQHPNYTDHLQTHVHGTDRPFVCSVCGRAFKGKSRLRHHQLGHASTQKHKCEVCGKKFLRAKNLEQHTQVHAEDDSSRVVPE